MASFRKKKNGTWEGTVSLGRDPVNPKKQIRKYVTALTEREVKYKARQLEQEYEDGLLLNIPNMRFEAWADKFFELKKNNIAPTTLICYKRITEKHIKPYFKKFKLQQINEMHIREYMAQKGDEKLSSASLHKHFIILSSMLGMAMKKKNPCGELAAPKVRNEPKYVPTNEEFDRLLNAVNGMWDELPILLAGWCGMRLGEVFCLKVNDIQGDKIKVDENRALKESESDEGPRYIFDDKDPKSENGIRRIATSEYLINLLKRWILKNGLKDDDYLFPMRPDSYEKRFLNLIKYHNMKFNGEKLICKDGRQAGLSPNSIYKLIKPQDKEIPKFTFHALRHYHATVLFEEDIPDIYAAGRMGHDVIVMKKKYQKLREQRANALDKQVKSIFKKPS